LFLPQSLSKLVQDALFGSFMGHFLVRHCRAAMNRSFGTISRVGSEATSIDGGIAQRIDVLNPCLSSCQLAANAVESFL
jgi:hypothetical protein